MRTHRPAYLPALDGLRAIAVLLVLWSHVLPQMPGYPPWLVQLRALLGPGELGVEIFFVLSGFLITRILLAEKAAARPVRWFLLRRMLRIFPIYYLLLLVILFVQPGPTLLWCALYLSNFWFLVQTEANWLPHTWSLCIEEHFYLLWPFAVAMLPLRWARRVMAFFVLPGAIVAAIVICSQVAPARAAEILQLASPIRFLDLGAGCLCAFAEPRLTARPRRALAVGAVLFALGVASWPGYWLFFAPQQLGFGLPLAGGPVLGLLHSCLLATGLVLITIAGSFGRQWFVRPLQLAPLRGIGRISYGLYLYHFPLYVAVMGGRQTPGRLALALLLTFAVAIASYWLVERPLLRLGARFR
ncbi:MAG: acyltransferase [Planctomycetes bacterium]|nr:acyltransferase [Planctomycetota bacterium]